MKDNKSEKENTEELKEIYQNFVVGLRHIKNGRDEKINKIIKEDDNNQVNGILNDIKKQN